MPEPPPPPPVYQPPSWADQVHAVSWHVPVYYATNQKLLGWKAGRVAFGPGRDALRFGRAMVSIPFTHRVGEIERPGLFFTTELANKHFVTEASYLLDPAAWSQRIQRQAKLNGKSQILVFVHGYNVPFEDALHRTAQISWDVRFKGPSIMYAWPSGARMRRYMSDEASAQMAEADLVRTLRHLLTTTKVDEFYLIAHSMGNRVLTEALLEIERTMPVARRRIKEVILAAPDIDADYFKNKIAPRLPKITQGLTLYASRRDMALMLSSWLHGARRVGYARGGVITARSIDTIDASGLRGDLLGHSVFADASAALRDIARVINDDTPPGGRGLIRMARPQLYWAFPSTPQ